MESFDYFYKDMKQASGGMLIVDHIDNERIIILGRSNVPKRLEYYESFGGKYEKEDITSLHTAVRELVEEFFNTKIDPFHVNNIAIILRKNNLIIKQRNFYGMAYMIDFNGLNFIFNYLCTINMELAHYNVDGLFNMMQYIGERVVDGSPNNGLNEIKSLHIIKISDIKNNMIKLRWYTNKIIGKMIKS
jgi:hypothetical protein